MRLMTAIMVALMAGACLGAQWFVDGTLGVNTNDGKQQLSMVGGAATTGITYTAAAGTVGTTVTLSGEINSTTHGKAPYSTLKKRTTRQNEDGC